MKVQILLDLDLKFCNLVLVNEISLSTSMSWAYITLAFAWEKLPNDTFMGHRVDVGDEHLPSQSAKIRCTIGRCQHCISLLEFGR